MTGTLLNQRYRIMRPLGKGGMGAVYAAVDLRLNNTVAVKRMIAEAAEANRAFEREARLLAALRHPALPVVIDYFTEPAGQFLVMQYIERRGPRARAQSARTARGTRARTLCDNARRCARVSARLRSADHPSRSEAAQRQSNAGRRVCPARLRPRNGTSRLRLHGRGRRPEHLWLHAAVFGYTPQYSPPEQLDRRRTDPRSDTFALGATLFHLGSDCARKMS